MACPTADSPLAASSGPPPLPAPPSASAYERLLEFSVIALGAYAGAFARVALQGSPQAPQFTLLSAQLIGTFILGCVSPSQARLMGGPRLHRLLYIGVASGLCGSITTFSAYAFEAHKPALLMGDASWAHVGWSYHGGRFLEWALELWGGFILPLAALHGGQHLAACLEARRGAGSAGAAPPPPLPAPPPAAAAVPPPPAAAAAPPPPAATAAPPPPAWHATAEALILLAFAAATALAVGLPVVRGWAFLAYTAVFGAAGAYLRYRLAACNKRPPSLLCCGKLSAWAGADRGRFPCGTFAANMLGTWALAGAMAASKFGVSYHALGAQAALYGVVAGFCGCLTTMSTFALELHTLPREAAYFYAAASVLGAQAGLALLYETSARAAAERLLARAAAPPPLLPCALYPSLCGSLLDSVGCPAAARAVAGCAAGPGDTAAGLRGFACRCGALDASQRLAQLIVDAQAKGAVAAAMVPVLPAPPDGAAAFAEPLESFDFCLSYERVCHHVLSRISCPAAARAVDACGRGGLRAFVGLCACGGFTVPGAGDGGGGGRVAELLADAALQRRYDFAALRGRAAARLPLDLCEEQRRACGALLDHVMCPPPQRRNAACATRGDVATFEGACACFGRGGPSFNRTPLAVMDAFMGPSWLPFVAARPAPANASARGVDACASFASLCGHLLDSAGCPAGARRVEACAPPQPGANATVALFVGACLCGDPGAPLSALASARVKDYVIDAALALDLEPHVFIPPPTTPFWIAATSSPFKQLLAPMQPLPGSST
jgi:CrcB protein